MKVTFRENPGCKARIDAKLQRAQVYIDNSVIRFCTVRIPRRTGALINSGHALSVPGEGKVRFGTAYGAFQYYRTAQHRPYDALRGGQWFARGKAMEAGRVLENAQKIVDL